MTLKEKMLEISPEDVSDDYQGGVRLCPTAYSFLGGHFKINTDETCAYDTRACDNDCEKCWSQPYIEDYATDTNVGTISDNVNHPEYYQGKRECIEEMRLMFGDEAVKGFCRCSAYKYNFRAGKKDGESAEKDKAKAEWYIDYIAKMEQEEN